MLSNFELKCAPRRVYGHAGTDCLDRFRGVFAKIRGSFIFTRGVSEPESPAASARTASIRVRARRRSVWHSQCDTACARLRRSRVSRGPLAACAAMKAQATIVTRTSQDLNARQFHNNPSALHSALLGQISARGNGQRAGAGPDRRAVDGRVPFDRARHAGVVRYPRSHWAFFLQIFSTCLLWPFEPTCDAVAPPGPVNTAPRAPNTSQGSCVGNLWPPCVPDAVFEALWELCESVFGLYFSLKIPTERQ